MNQEKINILGLVLIAAGLGNACPQDTIIAGTLMISGLLIYRIAPDMFSKQRLSITNIRIELLLISRGWVFAGVNGSFRTYLAPTELGMENGFKIFIPVYQNEFLHQDKINHIADEIARIYSTTKEKLFA